MLFRRGRLHRAFCGAGFGECIVIALVEGQLLVLKMQDPAHGAVEQVAVVADHHHRMRIDQDDRIALLGKNGEGKSTLSKLISGRLKTSAGRLVTHNKLRIGYFAQHQVDELNLDETPAEIGYPARHSRRRRFQSQQWAVTALRAAGR